MIKLSAFLKNIVTTTITSLITIISMIFIMRYLAQGLGQEEFGAYSLARRIIANFAPLALLSVDIALVRYIAMTKESRNQAAYTVSALISSGSALIVFLIIAFAARAPLSYLIFHSHNYRTLFSSSCFLLAGYCLFMITYSFYRGRQKFNTANSLQIALMAIFPLAVAAAFAAQKNSAFIVFLMGSIFYLALIPLGMAFKQTKLPSFKDIKSSLKTLLRYGLPRAPAGFAFAGLLTLGPFLAVRFWGQAEAGFFVIGQSVFRIMESAIVGFGLVALPKVSQMLADKKVEFLKSKIEDVLIMIVQIGLFVTIHTFLWSKEIVVAWLGFDYMEAVPIMKVIILSLVPYLGYVILRSIVDAVEVKAINTLNLFLSLGIAAVLSLVLVYSGFGITGLAAGSALGFFALGLLTASYLIRRYRMTFANSLFPWILILNIGYAGLILLFKKYAASSLGPTYILIVGFLFECGLFLSYMVFLYRKNTRWLLELKKRVFL